MKKKNVLFITCVRVQCAAPRYMRFDTRLGNTGAGKNGDGGYRHTRTRYVGAPKSGGGGGGGGDGGDGSVVGVPPVGPNAKRGEGGQTHAHIPYQMTSAAAHVHGWERSMTVASVAGRGVLCARNIGERRRRHHARRLSFAPPPSVGRLLHRC